METLVTGMMVTPSGVVMGSPMTVLTSIMSLIFAIVEVIISERG